MPHNIYFSSKEGAVPGYWSDNRFPYSRGVLEAFADPHIQEIVLLWATQLGKTAILTSLVNYIASNEPSPLMIACPDQASAHEHYKTKLEPAMEECPSVKGRMLPKRDRNMELVDLGDMWVYYAWSGAKRTLSSRSIRFLYITELGLWSYSKDREGDPLKMARDRCKAFPNRKIFVEGKPTLKGECRLSQTYDESDQRSFHVPCPMCGHYQALLRGTVDSPGGLKWEKGPDGHSQAALARQTAYYQCEECLGHIEDRHKLLMLRKGIWLRAGLSASPDGKIAGEPVIKGRRAGFYLNSLYSSLLTFGECAEEWVLASKGSILDLQAHINSWWAQPFDLRGRRIEHDDILQHICPHIPSNWVPDPDSKLVCTVDVQQQELYYVIRAWSPGGSSWMLRYGVIDGFAALDTLLAHAYPGEGRHEFRVGLILIDSGYEARQTEVYDYCQNRVGVLPCKGRPRSGRQSSILHVSRVPDRELDLWLVDAFSGNNQLFDRRLRVRIGDPGYWALHRDVGRDYSQHFLSVTRTEEESKKTGFREIIWKQIARDDHYLDCERLQEAAAFHYGFSFTKRPAASPVKNVEPIHVRKEPTGYARRDGSSWLRR